MGESFGNLMHSVFEKKPEPLYDSEVIFVQRCEDAKKERPKSQALQKAHPDLYDFLLKKESAKKFNVGIIHLDGNGAISKELAKSGKNPLQIVIALREMFRSELLKIAEKIKENPSSDLGKIDFLTAASRLVSAESSVQQLGFEAFDIDDGEEMKFNDASHKRAGQTYEILSKKGTTDQDPKIVKDKPAKIILISKHALMDLLEKETKPVA